MECGEHSVITASVLLMLELSAVMLDTLKVSRINPPVISLEHHNKQDVVVCLFLV